jgi:hypothetical protein
MLAIGLSTAVTAQAFPVTICVPKKASTAVTTPNTKGECPAENTVQYALGGAEKEVFKYLIWTPTGIDGKPTIGFTQANFRIYGEAKSGTGNLLVGKEPVGAIFEGSNNLVSGEDAGTEASAEDSVIFGSNNFAGSHTSILGGDNAKTFGKYSVVVGGASNSAIGEGSVVLGGESNSTASAAHSSVIDGGRGNQAEALASWIGGGKQNVAEGKYSSVFGGLANTAKAEYEAIP